MSRPTEKRSREAASIAVSATALAARMNARPLPDDCDGGEWFAFTAPHNVPTVADECDGCGKLAGRDASVTCGTLTLCLPCALADCELAEANHTTTKGA